MRQYHTKECRSDSIKGGIWMFFASITISLLAQEIPYHIHIEPVKYKYSSDKSSPLHVFYPGRKSLY